ncbi:glutaredoxin family protein [Halobacillus rhizosphaerae]|uniref:glutaredoxin family protein n=1 Tax=Halobacillus rhizosphaerae TaxID=3064889 RepID=UPI00398AFAB8
MNHIQLLMRKGCHLCEEMRTIIEMAAWETEIEVTEIDIEKNEELLQRYMLEIPVVIINGEELDYRSINLSSLRERLQ